MRFCEREDTFVNLLVKRGNRSRNWISKHHDVAHMRVALIEGPNGIWADPPVSGRDVASHFRSIWLEQAFIPIKMFGLRLEGRFLSSAVLPSPEIGCLRFRQAWNRWRLGIPFEKNTMACSYASAIRFPVNDFLQSQNRGLEFSVDKSTGKTLIKVVDRTNGKILRQIPPEYVVRLAQTLHYPDQMSSTGIKTKA